jgi:hypothetical protein
MKRSLTILTAAIFAASLTAPAFAQQIQPNVNTTGVGNTTGTQMDNSNSDREMAVPNPDQYSSPEEGTAEPMRSMQQETLHLPAAAAQPTAQPQQGSNSTVE